MTCRTERPSRFQLHDALRLANGQHPQQHLIHQREDGGIRADAEASDNTAIPVKIGLLESARSANRRDFIVRTGCTASTAATQP